MNPKADLERLVEEGPRIAPSIARYENRNYGKVTDEDLDNPSYLRWKIEAETLLQSLAASHGPAFQALYREYVTLKEAAKKLHSTAVQLDSTFKPMADVSDVVWL